LSLFTLDGMLNLPALDVSYNLQKYFVREIIKTSFDEPNIISEFDNSGRLTKFVVQTRLHPTVLDLIILYKTLWGKIEGAVL